MARAPLVPHAVARRLFLGAQGLFDDPERPATLAAVRGVVEQLGFVQVDSIHVLARAHDLTLAARLDGYRAAHLAALLGPRRALFEHWTHDASVIPLRWYPHWKRRFRADATRLRERAWWRAQLGEDGDAVVGQVRARIEREGPLRSADFEHGEKRGGWWDWKPQKAALEYLWRTGDLAVRGRDRFQKVYDLASRVLPRHHALVESDPEEHTAWACETAAERLVVFTPRELAAFWNAITPADAAAWCREAVREGRVEAVRVESADGTAPQDALALHDWSPRAKAWSDAPPRARLLSPFDPVVRDRARALRRFGFDYRFEAYTPAARRKYGYYALPILDGDRLVGRIEPRLDRARGALSVRGPWWEHGVSASRARRVRLEAALERMAALVGAATVAVP